LAQRPSTTISKPKTIAEAANPGKGEKYDFQNYYIIGFRCPVFKNKTTKITRTVKQENSSHSKEKNNQQKLSRKRLHTKCT
jgi:hypothetical protein